MKTVYKLITLGIFLSFTHITPVLAADLSLYQMMRPLSPKQAESLSPELSKQILKDVTAGPRGIAFTYKGIVFQLVINDRQSKTLSLNGTLFTQKELVSTKTIEKALAKHMGLLPARQFGFLNFILPELQASQQGLDGAYRSYDLIPLRAQSNPISLAELKKFFSKEKMGEVSEILSSLMGAVNNFAFNDEGFNKTFSMPNPESIAKPSFMRQ